jgi:hypothetical protein
MLSVLFGPLMVGLQTCRVLYFTHCWVPQVFWYPTMMYLMILICYYKLSVPTLGSIVHHVSVPGSVADTHRLNKINIKNHTFINNGETHYKLSSYLHSLGHWPYNIDWSSITVVLRTSWLHSYRQLEVRT